jgi:hypothetical protein
MIEPVKVLYIAGAGRTGSTLLEKLLGQVPGMFAGGELTFLWGYGMRGRCSCGLPLLECDVWRAILASAYGNPDAIDPERMVDLRKRFNSVHLPLMVTKSLRRRLLHRLEEFPETVERLYRAIVETTGDRVVVDSSKEPHYSFILRSRPALDVRVLHLVRDPRAVAFSWAKHREQKGIPGSMMEVRSPAVSSAYYGVSNLATEMMWSRRRSRYLRVRYEDFVTDPYAVGDQIARLVDEPVDLRPILPDGHTGVVATTHSAWGNPNRFDHGPVHLRPDDEWTTAMKRWPRAVVTALNGPFVARYGYRHALRHPTPPRASVSHDGGG